MKDVVLITNYWHFECEKASSRYLTLANMIVNTGMDLEIITSNFYHATKSQRDFDDEFLSSLPYKVTLIDEIGYTKNISIKRLISHRIFANNVLRYIKKRKKPDIIYCVVPSLDVAEFITTYANENNIKVIIDIQDLWPEAFKIAFNIPIISNILFVPLKRKANKIYASADEIIAVSQSYVDRALEVNKKCKKGQSVYLGIELTNFDQYLSNSNVRRENSDEIWIAYVGTLGYSYDIISVIDSLKILSKQGMTNVRFIVMGDGPLKEKFEKHATKTGVNVEFTGKLNYRRMVKLLSKCDIAVNPIVKNSAASIINKHADYFAAGLPILNTQQSHEFKKLLSENNAGLNCESNNPIDLSKKLMMLIQNTNLRTQMGKNSRKLAEQKFNREVTYQEIVELIKNK